LRHDSPRRFTRSDFGKLEESLEGGGLSPKEQVVKVRIREALHEKSGATAERASVF
jgi:hypothetical protein